MRSEQAAVCAVAAIHYVQFADLDRGGAPAGTYRSAGRRVQPPLLAGGSTRTTVAATRPSHGTGNQIEAAALEALQLGQAAGQPDVLTWFAPELFAARWAQGRLAEMVPLIDQVASGSPGLPAWRAALAVSCISAGDLERAVCIVNDLMAEGESVFPQDIAWLLGHSVLAEAVAGVGTASRQSANTRPCFHTPAGFPIWRWLRRPAVSLWLAMLAARGRVG